MRSLRALIGAHVSSTAQAAFGMGAPYRRSPHRLLIVRISR